MTLQKNCWHKKIKCTFDDNAVWLIIYSSFFVSNLLSLSIFLFQKCIPDTKNVLSSFSFQASVYIYPTICYDNKMMVKSIMIISKPPGLLITCITVHFLCSAALLLIWLTWDDRSEKNLLFFVQLFKSRLQNHHLHPYNLIVIQTNQKCKRSCIRCHHYNFWRGDDDDTAMMIVHSIQIEVSLYLNWKGSSEVCITIFLQLFPPF